VAGNRVSPHLVTLAIKPYADRAGVNGFIRERLKERLSVLALKDF
jgi:hypothetical protein